MNICGIICEYNPFHNGHAYHIKKARELTQCDLLVCVMSGNFVQRGEPAVCDKWARAAMAIEQGCDVVIELPYPFVVQSADYFAAGAIAILQLAQINSLVFGSECNDVTYLREIAKTPLATYKAQQTGGISFAKTMERVHKKLSSNDILGVSYMKALSATSITPYTIQRTNGYHDDDTNLIISSASAIRKAIKEKRDVSHATPMAQQLQITRDMADYFPYIQTYLTISSKKQLQQLFLMDEGIESLLIKQAKTACDWETFLHRCVSKRYPTSSIQRTLTHLLTQTTKTEMNHLPSVHHLRPLAFNHVGKNYLRLLQEQDIPVASTFTNIPLAYRELELRAAYAYAFPLSLAQRSQFIKGELRPPVYIK